jgi:uncharacterized protein with PIN domain
MEPHRFLADAMLGRLARWLRVLGFDTAAAAGDVADVELVRCASVEQRVLLTRDRHLLRELRPARALAIRSEVPVEQLQQVVETLALVAPAELFTRCMVCNAPLEDVPAADHAGVVPPSSRGLAGPVRRCPLCERVYWPGSHVRRMRGALERALPGWLSPG